MFTIPKWALKLTSGRDRDLLLEYRLTTSDVARLCGVQRMQVHRWATEGRQGVRLQHRTFHAASGRPRYAFRFYDVLSFSRLFGVTLDLETLHPALLAEWNLKRDAP